MSMPALQIKDLYARYGESHILHSVDLTVNRGEVVTLLGRNGAGRTTTPRAITGLVGMRKGSIVVHDAGGQGVETVDLPTHRIAHHGIGYCPEERGIFSSLSREESLVLSPVLKGQVAKIGNAGMSIDEICEMFPSLAERRQSQGTRLSGGEQQMPVVERILRTGANLLLFDEISEGLVPVIVQALVCMILMLKKRGYMVVMVEQDFRFAALLTDRFYMTEYGRIVERSEAVQLQNKMPVLHKLLSV